MIAGYKKNCWPTRTRTLNDGTKNRSVANYTMGQYLITKASLAFERANLKQSLVCTNIFTHNNPKYSSNEKGTLFRIKIQKTQKNTVNPNVRAAIESLLKVYKNCRRFYILISKFAP